MVDDGRVVGAVSREDLDKAIGHDLAHAPVRGIMSGHVQTASEDATLAELQTSVAAPRTAASRSFGTTSSWAWSRAATSARARGDEPDAEPG